MAGLAPQAQVCSSRLISVNINHCSSDISVIEEKLLELVRMRARVPVFFVHPRDEILDCP